MKKPDVIVVCGPTATGKSDYAVALARAFRNSGIGAEVISADSRQVYRGLDIGSGKITVREMRGIPHHLLDVASPRTTFSVVQYHKRATKILRDILSRGNVPIVCGGSGFYIDALVHDLVLPEVTPDPKLRAILAKKSLAELHAELRTLDETRFETIDTHNRVRLIRAIEISRTLGNVPKVHRKSPYALTWVYLDMPDEILKERIHLRLARRMRAGMVSEVRHLHESGLSWKRLEALGLEYRFLARYLQRKLSKQEMLRELEAAIWQYAKRQRTWFKKYAR